MVLWRFGHPAAGSAQPDLGGDRGASGRRTRQGGKEASPSPRGENA